MIILLVAIGCSVAGIAFGFTGVLALLEHLKWKTWLAVLIAALLSLPIGIALGAAAAAALIFVMYPDFDWKF